MLAATFGLGQVALSFLWFAIFFIEIWLMITIFVDIFRSHDLPGWAKAGWIVLVLVFPLLGILAYLITRGGKMRTHQVRTFEEQDEMFRRYLQRTAGPQRSVTEELVRLAELRDRGDISADEYRRLKAQILGDDQSATA